jgi:hypothetical protein
MAMTDDVPDIDARKAHHQGHEHSSENTILCAGIRHVIGAFQFDADGKIIASLTPGEL